MIVKHGGKKLFYGDSNECFMYVLMNQPNSVEYACENEGWAIERINKMESQTDELRLTS